MQGVLGRPLGMKEIRRIIASENVVRWYRERETYKNDRGEVDWVGWSRDNPEGARLLAVAAKAAGEPNGE